jgi:hypothetical protein
MRASSLQLVAGWWRDRQFGIDAASRRASSSIGLSQS